MKVMSTKTKCLDLNPCDFSGSELAGSGLLETVPNDSLKLQTTEVLCGSAGGGPCSESVTCVKGQRSNMTEPEL